MLEKSVLVSNGDNAAGSPPPRPSRLARASVAIFTSGRDLCLPQEEQQRLRRRRICRILILWIIYTIVGGTLLIRLVSTKYVQTVVLNERLGITAEGRHRRRRRRWEERLHRHCDEDDEPAKFLLFGLKSALGANRRIALCEELDLSLRRNPLGDNGVRRLLLRLTGEEYATPRRPSKLRKLNLARQRITRRGAGYLARWLSQDPVDPEYNSYHYNNNNDNATTPISIMGPIVLTDAQRVPTAVSPEFFELHLEGNPISSSGRLALERAVYKAARNGLRVRVYGGGPCDDADRGNILRVGPVELFLGAQLLSEEGTDKWVLPAAAIDVTKWIRTYTMGFVLFCLGWISSYTIGPMLIKRFPYRLVIVHQEEATARSTS